MHNTPPDPMLVGPSIVAAVLGVAMILQPLVSRILARRRLRRAQLQRLR